MTRPRLPIKPTLVSPLRRGGGAGDPAPRPVPPAVGGEFVANAGERDIQLLVTVAEAARRLAIGRSHLYRYVQTGRLRSIQLGRARRVAVGDLAAFVDEARETGAA